jgi:hypothetical protein
VTVHCWPAPGLFNNNGTLTSIYSFTSIPPYPGKLFAVNVTQNGGSAGSSTARCSFTYDVYDKKTGAKIGSTLAPEGSLRIVECTFVAGTVGWAYFNPSNPGALVLAFVSDETADQSNC